MSSPGLEPGTASVLDWSHNQLDHEDTMKFMNFQPYIDYKSPRTSTS